jgi:heterogeneous nuclear ribonucleoprotein A1/A3
MNRIFVGGIVDKPVTKEDLELYFGEFGMINDSVIMIDKETGKSRGFGFVQFNDYDAVDRIVLSKYQQIKGVSVEVKKAVVKDGVEGGRSGGDRGRGARGRSADLVVVVDMEMVVELHWSWWWWEL